MKKMSKIVGILLVLTLLVSLTACSSGDKSNDSSTGSSSSSSNAKTFTVSFETNGGSSVDSQKVEEGKNADRPADPTKDGFFFGGWYTDAELNTPFEFDAAVAADTKLYAAWVDASGSVTANFYTDASTVFATAHFEDGGRISKPEDPTRDGYYFAGWYTEDGTLYKATVKFTGDQNFYAKWLTIYTFEAEKTQLTGLDPDEDDTCSDSGNKLGQSYSGNVSGANLIGGCACDASGDKYVTNLYYNGAFLEFEINCDEAVDDALLFLRLSAEFTEISLTKDTFLVLVNDEKINYEPITIKGGTTDDLTSTSRTPMTDYAMGNISLSAGKNVIRLEVANSDKQFATGTMDAAAPMIDAIKVYTNVNLSMTEYNN